VAQGLSLRIDAHIAMKQADATSSKRSSKEPAVLKGPASQMKGVSTLSQAAVNFGPHGKYEWENWQMWMVCQNGPLSLDLV